MNARVDVILPFRNAAATVDAALGSLLASGDDALTVLAIDDCSTDSSAASVRDWAQRDPRVRLLAGSGGGLVPTLNLGLAHARGTFVARMDADDLTHPERIARQRAYLLAHPEISVLGTRVQAFSEEGPLGEGLLRYVDWQNSLLTPEQHRRERFVESPLCHPSVMLRRSLLDAVGSYRELDGPEDYELFLRCAEHGHALAKLPEVLLSWRHQRGRATFADARYALARFRAVKAPYLARELARSARPLRRRLALWGAGPTGRRLARALTQHGTQLALFVDIDPAKIGRVAQGLPICSPDALDSEHDQVVVAVGARGARELIRADLEARGFLEGGNAWFAS
jgi:glycosyltransferase involved in cell wall biosynthesis